jgi:hypothetical protein
MCIVADDDNVIYKIDNLNEFYKAFGYTTEIAKTGLVADEFIWENYVKGSADACLQMHIVKYLNKHSAKFRELYGVQYESHVNSHVVTCETINTKCYACKHKPFCEI